MNFTSHPVTGTAQRKKSQRHGVGWEPGWQEIPVKIIALRYVCVSGGVRVYDDDLQRMSDGDP